MLETDPLGFLTFNEAKGNQVCFSFLNKLSGMELKTALEIIRCTFYYQLHIKNIK